MSLLKRFNSGLSELNALCVEDCNALDFANDTVHLNHTYKVKEFVFEDGFCPFGVRLMDYNKNELNQTFYIQRFVFFEMILN